MIKKQLFFLQILFLPALMFFSSCSSSKDFVYLQDMHVGRNYTIPQRHEATLQPDDRIAITVSCKQPELAMPFNARNAAVTVTAAGEVATAPAAAKEDRGYRVDPEGNIDFPMLGKIHVAGRTVAEVTEMLRDGIVSGNFIREPLVDVELLNFRYTVLGAVASNGTFSARGDRVTLLEAVANAGDLATNARVDRVAVIRETGDGRRIFMHDLRSISVFDSPCFYLQQNDIVYVEPKYRKKERSEKATQYITMALSAVATACTVIWATKK